jgi:hypothetical protein
MIFYAVTPTTCTNVVINVNKKIILSIEFL